MIFKLNIQKTYGQVSEDIAKKNKYNKITIPISSFEKQDTSVDYSDTSITNENQTENNLFEISTSKFIPFTGLRKCNKFIIPRIEYMSKTIEVDTNTDEYSALSTIQDTPQYETNWEGISYVEEYSSSAFNQYYPFGSQGNSLDDVKSFLLNADFEINVFPHANNSDITQNIVNSSGEENTISSDDADKIISEEYNNIKTELFYNVYLTSIDNVSEELKEISSSAAQTFQNLYENYSYITVSNFQSIPSEHKCKFDVIVPKTIQIVTISVRNTSNGYTVEDYTFIENDLNNFTITFKFGSYEQSTTETTYYTGAHEYIVDESFVNSVGVNYANLDYPSYYAGDLYENYMNGKQEISVRYPVNIKYNNKNQQVFFIDSIGLVTKTSGDYYTTDNSGNKVLCADYEAEDGTKYIGLIKSEYNISPNVQVGLNDFCYFVDNNDNPVYVYKNADGTDSTDPKLFLIKNPTLEYSGILYNNMTTIEMPDGKFLSIKSDEQTNVIVTRISSEKSFAPLKVLNVNDIIWEGDVLQITRTSQTGYYNTMTINGSEYTDNTYTVTGNTDIVVDSALITYTFTRRSGTTATITRTSSPIGNGELGTLSTGDTLYVNDTIEIYTNVNVGEYEIRNGTQVDSSDTLTYGGIDKTISVQGNVTVYVRQASYRWVEIYSMSSDQWQNLSHSFGGSTSTIINIADIKTRQDKTKDDYRKTYELRVTYYNGQTEIISPFMYVEGVDSIDDLNFDGSGILLALDITDLPDVLINVGGFGVNVTFDCETDGELTIVNTTNQSGYPANCYFTAVNIASIMQYEYS